MFLCICYASVPGVPGKSSRVSVRSSTLLEHRQCNISVSACAIVGLREGLCQGRIIVCDGGSTILSLSLSLAASVPTSHTYLLAYPTI